jgi:hypothetical protein
VAVGDWQISSKCHWKGSSDHRPGQKNIVHGTRDSKRRSAGDEQIY